MSAPRKASLAGSERAPLKGAREIGPANPTETLDVTIRLRSRAGKKPIVDANEFGHHVLGSKGAGPAADELGDPRQGIGPERGIQRRIVDAADNAAQLIVFAHVTFRTRRQPDQLAT